MFEVMNAVQRHAIRRSSEQQFKKVHMQNLKLFMSFMQRFLSEKTFIIRIKTSNTIPRNKDISKVKVEKLASQQHIVVVINCCLFFFCTSM